MTPEESTVILELALQDLKASDIKILDVRKLTSIADFMIIASGRSNRQLRAMADRVIETAKQHGMEIFGVEGQKEGEWVLIDLGDIIVHAMQPAVREYYQLEKLWSQEGMQTSVPAN